MGGRLLVWYYKDGEAEVGPISTDELKLLIKEKKINGRTLLRSAKGVTWKPLVERIKKKTKGPVATHKPPEQTLKEEPVETSKSSKQAPEEGAELSTPQKLTAQTVTPESLPSKVTPDFQKGRGAQSLPFKFTGNGSEYFKIWIVNIVLSLLTLGIYSAWAKVRRKQYFYGNTRVNDASFNYLANPVTILKGRAVVFVGFVIYSLINQFFPIAGGVIMLLMLPLLPWFVVKALSFNARNSATRNIRFTFKGTYFEAAKAYIFWPMLIPFTLGFIFPHIYYKQKKFLVENSGYGTTNFVFTAQSGDYYRIFLRLLLPLIACIIIGAIAGYFLPASYMLLMMIFYLYAIAYISVNSTNLLYNSSRLAKHDFQSTMQVKQYLGILIINTLATVFTAGFFHPFAQVRAYRYQIENLTFRAVGDLDQFVADEKSRVSALGDEAAELFDFDIGL